MAILSTTIILVAAFLLKHYPKGVHAPLGVSLSENRVLDITRLQEHLVQFAKDRDWEKFHTPKNLAMALAGEAGELLEIFQWLSTDQSKQVMSDPKEAVKVRDELADVVIYAVRLAGILGIDVERAIFEKMSKNASKYPVHLAKGNAKKYTEFEGD